MLYTNELYYSTWYKLTYRNIGILIMLLFSFNIISCSQMTTSETSYFSPTKKHSLKDLSNQDLENYRNALKALRKNKLDQAENILIEFIDSQPELAGPWANLGLVYYKKNKIKEAEKALNKALKLNPKNSYAYNLLGIIENKKGEFKNAEKNYLLAISNKRNYANAYYNIALLYDIYFHEIRKSIIYYKRYLMLIKNKGKSDQQTVDWLEQLENSLKKG